MRSAETLRRAQRWARRHQIQQHGGILPDAGHLHQCLRRSLKHSVQRTEVLDQPVGQLVGVPAGDGIVQQQLQHLMIRQTVGSLLQEALPLAPGDVRRAVPCVLPPSGFLGKL